MQLPRIVAVGLVTVAASGLLAAPAGASTGPAITKLTCSAKMSNSRPKQYSTIQVEIHSAAAASVTTSAKYRTTITKHAGKTNSAGNVNIAYKISRATVGFKVVVSVSVAKAGYTTGGCSTSFTPIS